MCGFFVVSDDKCFLKVVTKYVKCHRFRGKNTCVLIISTLLAFAGLTLT